MDILNENKERQEETMSERKMNLTPLMCPKSIAMIGASEKNFFGMMIFENLKKQGYEGKVYPINPKHEMLAGHKCYPSLDAVPEAPDMVLIMTRRDLVKGMVEQAIRKGAGSAVIISAGFGETGEAEWAAVEQEIGDMARANNFPICGPNCLGVVNTYMHVATMGAPVRGGLLQGNVALVMGSGGMMLGLTYPCYQRRIGLTYGVSTGNSLVLDATDYIDFVLDDPNTKVVCTFIEGVRKPENLIHVCKKALKLKKPIIVLKTGATPRGKRATFAHTSSIAGDDAVFDAILKKYGVTRVSDFDEMLEAIALFSKAVEWPYQPKATRMCFLSASGGACGLLSDLAQTLGVELPELKPETQKRLRQIFTSGGFIANPIDATGQVLNDLPAYRKALEIIKDDPQIGLIVSFETVGFPSHDTPTHKRRLLQTIEMCKELQFPMVSCSLNPHSLDEWQSELLQNEKAFAFIQGAGKTLRVLDLYMKYLDYMRTGNLPLEEVKEMTTGVEALLEKTKSVDVSALSESELLTLYSYSLKNAVDVIA